MKICIYFDRKETEIVHLCIKKKNTHSFKKKQKKGCPLATTRNHISVNLDQKGPEIMHIWLKKYKIFLRHGGTAPMQPPKSCIGLGLYFDRKGTEIVHLWFPKIHILLRSAAPLWPLEIIYFCKSRPKRAWNYAYLARKMQNFLRQWGAAPFQPP